MNWLEQALAGLQQGGAPSVGALSASPFPAIAAPPQYDEAQMAQEAAEAAAKRIRGGQIRIGPQFTDNPLGMAGINLALDSAPAGTGVSGNTNFALGVPPSVGLAKDMTAPPQPQQASMPALPPPQEVVPLPRPRPAEADGEVDTATDMSSRNRAPMGFGGTRAPPMVLPAEPASSGGFGDTLKKIAPALLGLGGALQGDGGAMTAALLKRESDLETQRQGVNLTSQALLSRGAPAAEVAAAARNPDLMKALVGRYFETKPAQVVNGRLVRERADGKVDTLADFSADEKAPTQREMTLPDGSIQRQEWVGGKWNDVGRPAPKDKDRRLSVTDIGKLSEEGGKLNQINTFQSSFKPQFGGWKSDWVGDLANNAGRKLSSGVVGKDIAEGAAWWQDYDRYKNMVRHELFGSALTAGETKAFTQADITPGMTPEQIQRNLATQKSVVEKAIRRKGKGLIGSTYDRNAIASAYGVEPDFFDREDAAAPRTSGKTANGISWSVN